MDKKIEDKLLTQLQTIASSLEKLTLFRELDAFYPGDERKRLIAEYRALREADAIAFAGIEAARKEMVDAGLGWEARVEKYGEDEATEQSAPLMASLDARRSAMANVDEFGRRHPTIIALLRAYPAMDEPSPDRSNG